MSARTVAECELEIAELKVCLLGMAERLYLAAEVLSMVAQQERHRNSGVVAERVELILKGVTELREVCVGMLGLSPPVLAATADLVSRARESGLPA